MFALYYPNNLIYSVSYSTIILNQCRLLAQRGLKKGDLSKFIEDAVKWRVFDQTTTETREAFVDLAPESLQDLIDEATESVRMDMRNTLVRAAKKES